jgi:hypothetical protein
MPDPPRLRPASVLVAQHTCCNPHVTLCSCAAVLPAAVLLHCTFSLRVPSFAFLTHILPVCLSICRELNGRGLLGSLPPQWAALTSLQYLYAPSSLLRFVATIDPMRCSCTAHNDHASWTWKHCYQITCWSGSVFLAPTTLTRSFTTASVT